MNSLRMAMSYLRQAEERIKHAREALESGNYPYVVRQCQETVELMLKAALRAVGVEPPKLQDVGPILKRERERFPSYFKEVIDRLASISRKLRNERELAMYGDEEMGIPPEELYTKEDAQEALEMALFVHSYVKRLINDVVAAGGSP